MQLQSQSRTYSRYNVLAQTTQPMDVSDQLLSKLAVLSQQNNGFCLPLSVLVLILSNSLLPIFAAKRYSDEAVSTAF